MLRYTLKRDQLNRLDPEVKGLRKWVYQGQIQVGARLDSL